jgi:hypothetical protein
VDIPTKWIIIWLPNHGYQFPTSKSTWKPNFAQIGGFLYFGGHFGRHSKPTMDIKLQHHNLLGNQISPKSEDFCISHSKPTMDINLQHHNLLENQISPKSEDFCT